MRTRAGHAPRRAPKRNDRPARRMLRCHTAAWRIAAGAAALLFCIPSCAVNPVTGRPAVVLTSSSQERELGSREAEKVETSIGLVDDAKLAAYVDAIGHRLVQQFPKGDFEYEFAIVDMEEPNAFALPGGFIYVSRGLLALVNSEDELACVIGHEIGHVAARHSSRQLTLTAPFALVTGLGSLATGIVSPALGDVVAGIGGLTTGLLAAPYGRQQEREADDLGMQLAARAGWDPAGMSAFLHTLEREEALRTGSARRFSFLASHPTTPERVRATTAGAETLERGSGRPVAGDHEAVLRKLDGLLVGEDPSDGVFTGDRFLHPDLGFALTMPEEWQRENSPGAVSAIAPQGDAAFVLTPGEGNDPETAAAAVAEKLGLNPEREVRRFSVAGRRAAQLQAEARTDRGRVALVLTWILHDERVYQMTGMCKPATLSVHAPVFREMAGSFRGLTKAERGSIRESRLRLVRARGGERLDAVVVRTGATWTAAEAAVANALEVDELLRKGQALKVPLPQSYAGRRTSAP